MIIRNKSLVPRHYRIARDHSQRCFIIQYSYDKQSYGVIYDDYDERPKYFKTRNEARDYLAMIAELDFGVSIRKFVR